METIGRVRILNRLRALVRAVSFVTARSDFSHV